MSLISEQEQEIRTLTKKLSLLQKRVLELEAENAKLRSLLSIGECKPENAKLSESSPAVGCEPDYVAIRSSENSINTATTLSHHSKRHIALKIMYFGKRFHGFASDAQMEPTVESEIFKALKKTRLLLSDKKEAQYSRCGRTDKGVSSVGQVITLVLRSKLKESDAKKQTLVNIPFEEDIKEEIDYPYVINRVLPDDIRVLGWCPVSSDFNARFSCLSREYKYLFWEGNLNIKAMEKAGEKLIGEHDFRNFCKMDAVNVHNYRRNITLFSISPLWKSLDASNRLLVITIKGSAFLWHQVRCMVAVLFMVGQGHESSDIVDVLLDTGRTPRKPQYRMAPEVPLLLHTCEFDGLNFFCSRDAQQALESHLESLSLAYQLEAAIYMEGLKCSQSLAKDVVVPMDHVMTKKKGALLPLLSRPTEPSYDERRIKIEHSKCKK